MRKRAAQATKGRRRCGAPVMGEGAVSKLEDLHSRGMPETLCFQKAALSEARVERAIGSATIVREKQKNIAWAKLAAVRDELNIFQPRTPGPHAMPAHHPKAA